MRPTNFFIVLKSTGCYFINNPWLHRGFGRRQRIMEKNGKKIVIKKMKKNVEEKGKKKWKEQKFG